MGEWLNDKQHEFGRNILLDNAYYEGQYKDGLKHGKGILNFADDQRMREIFL